MITIMFLARKTRRGFSTSDARGTSATFSWDLFQGSLSMSVNISDNYHNEPLMEIGHEKRRDDCRDVPVRVYPKGNASGTVAMPRTDIPSLRQSRCFYREGLYRQVNQAVLTPKKRCLHPPRPSRHYTWRNTARTRSFSP